MAVDLNMDVGAAFKEFMAKRKAGEAGGSGATSGGSPLDALGAYKNLALYGVGLVIGIALFVYLLYLPKHARYEAKMTKLAEVHDKKKQLDTLNLQIAALKKQLSNSKTEYLEGLQQFGNSEDLDDLYKSISDIADRYGLVVANMKEISTKKRSGAVPTSTAGSTAATATDTAAAPVKTGPEVIETKVKVDLRGRYAQYMRFKEDLAIAETLLTINTETIKISSTKENPGHVQIELDLTTYAIDKTPFKTILQDDEGQAADKQDNDSKETSDAAS